MTMMSDIKALLAPYAEHPCGTCGGGRIVILDVSPVPSHAEVNGHKIGPDGVAMPCATRLDKRFAALRGEHDFDEVAKCHRCGLYERKHLQNEQDEVATTRYCLDTSLGALVRVADACGFSVHIGNVYGEGWSAAMAKGDEWSHGDTPEDALAQAIVAAVSL